MLVLKIISKRKENVFQGKSIFLNIKQNLVNTLKNIKAEDTETAAQNFENFWYVLKECKHNILQYFW